MVSDCRVVVLAHKYPPFSGVGANRWAHLSWGLHKLGYRVSVLTVDRGKIPIPYSDLEVISIANSGIYRLLGKRFNSKLFTGIYNRLLDILKKAIWYDDEAQYLGGKIRNSVERILKMERKGIILIATGHPFQANRWAAQLKKDYPDQIILIQDFRDPWADNPFKRYFFRYQRRMIKNWQDEALAVSDANVFVTEGLQKLMAPNSEEKSLIIENGHSFPIMDKKKDNPARYIVHAGTLANGRDKVAEAFFELCFRDQSVLQKCSVRFYGRISYWLLSKYSSLFDSGIFIHCDTVSQKELADIYRGAEFALQFNASEYPYLVSTKIYEHAALGLPTLSVNEGGEIDSMMKEFNIGISCKPDASSIKSAISDVFEIEWRGDLLNFAKVSTFNERAKQYSYLIERLLDKGPE